jgi:hypothetical protein
VTDLSNPSIVPTRREQRDARRRADQANTDQGVTIAGRWYDPAAGDPGAQHLSALADEATARRTRAQTELEARTIEGEDGQLYEYRLRYHATDILRPYATIIACALTIAAAAWTATHLLNTDQAILITTAAALVSAARWLQHRT